MNPNQMPNYSLRYSVLPGFEVKRPDSGSAHAAGVDVYCPYFNEAFISAFSQKRFLHYDKIVIPPHHSVVLPTGLHFIIPEYTYLEVKNRSSVASKKLLI